MKNQPTPKNLLQLRREWDLKLKQSGFEDIEFREKPHCPLKRFHSYDFASDAVVNRFEANKKYYDLCDSFALFNKFESEKQKEIWTLHLSGMSYRQIAKELKKRNYRFCGKDVVAAIVKALKAKMFRMIRSNIDGQ